MTRVRVCLAYVLLAFNSADSAGAMSSKPPGADPAEMQRIGGDAGAVLQYIAGDAHKPGSPEMMKELESLIARLSHLWNPPAGATDPQELTVGINIKLKRDGTLAGPPTVLGRGDSPLFKAACDGAVKAIYQGQPFTMLRPEHYDDWKEITVRFDPRYVPSR